MASLDFNDPNVFAAIDKEIAALGTTNILIVGRSGVGKSTLINAIFKYDIAKEGHGRPVTQCIEEYLVPKTQVVLFDTKGLEMKDYQKIVSETENYIKKRRASDDANTHIHLAWMCIAEGSSRLEDGEIMFISMLRNYLPVIVVITQCYMDDGVQMTETVKQYCGNIPIAPVISKEKLIRREAIPSMGLKELVQKTEDLLSDAHKIAFIAAQKVNNDRKQEKAHGCVALAATAAAAAGAAPIPFSDVVVLAPIQATMIAGITNIYGFEVNQSVIMAILGTLATVYSATVLGLVATNLLKMIPGVGTIAGGWINASVAASITTAFGEAYIAILNALFLENNGKQPSVEQLLEKCKTFKKEKK